MFCKLYDATQGEGKNSQRKQDSILRDNEEMVSR